MARYLWIDFWLKRVWVAVETEGFAFAYDIYPRVSIMKDLKKVISEKGITDIVVWMPYDLYGKDTDRVEKVNKFVASLKDIFKEVKIHTFDERFTSFEASLIMDDLGIKWDKEGKKDAISAQRILDGYLRSVGR